LIKKTLILWAETLLFGEWTNPPTLLLAPNSTDFQQSVSPSPFIVTASGYNTPEYSTDWKTRDGDFRLASNYVFYIYLEDLNIKIGANNPGCDHAVYWACAQQTGIRNVTIDGGSAAYAIETGLDGGGGVLDGLSVSNSVNGFVSNATSQMMVRNCTFNCPVTINNYYLSSWAFIGCRFNHASGFTTNAPVAISLLDCQFPNNSPLHNSGPVHLEQVQFSSPIGSTSAFVSVAGSGISIVGIWFWNSSYGKCGEFNVDASSSVLDCHFWNIKVDNPSVSMNFTGGCGGLFENLWQPGMTDNGINVSSNGPLELFALQPEHFNVASLTFNGASNVIGLNIQGETSASYVSIKDSNNIYMTSVLAGNWDFNSDHLITIQNSSVELFGLQVNRNSSCVVLDETTNPFLKYGASASGDDLVTLNGFIKR
jgi:hypothetical protein